MNRILQPEGPRSVVIGQFAEMFARSLAFASATGLDDWEEVLSKHVFYPSFRDPEGLGTFPFAIVSVTPGYSRSRLTDGLFRSRGVVRIGFGRTYEPFEDGRDPLIEFLNWSDAILSDLVTLADSEDFRLRLESFDEAQEAMHTDRRDEGVSRPFYDNWFDVTWAPFA